MCDKKISCVSRFSYSSWAPSAQCQTLNAIGSRTCIDTTLLSTDMSGSSDEHAPRLETVQSILDNQTLPLLVQRRSGDTLLLNKFVRIPYVVCQKLDHPQSKKDHTKQGAEEYFLIPLNNKGKRWCCISCVAWGRSGGWLFSGVEVLHYERPFTIGSQLIDSDVSQNLPKQLFVAHSCR